MSYGTMTYPVDSVSSNRASEAMLYTAPRDALTDSRVAWQPDEFRSTVNWSLHLNLVFRIDTLQGLVSGSREGKSND